MKNTKHLIFGTVLFQAASLHAAIITWDGGGADILWSTPANWTNDTVPTAGNTYEVDGATIRPPTGTDTVVFDGDSLTVKNGAILNLYRANGGATKTVHHTIPGLSVTNSQIRPQSDTATCYHHLDSAVAFSGANTLWLNENSGFTMNFYFNAEVTGTGSLAISRDDSGSGRTVFFNGSAAGYSGNISAASSVAETLAITLGHTTGWGTGSLTLGNYATANLNVAVNQPTASLVLTDADAIANVGNVSAILGSLSGTGGLVQGTGASSSLTVTQATDGTYAGTLGFTAGNALTFVKDGTGDLDLTGTINPGIPISLNAGSLHLGSRTIHSLTANGGDLAVKIGTGSAELTTITNAYTNNGGGIEVRVTSPPTIGAPYTVMTFGSFSGTNPTLTVTGLDGTRLGATPTYGANNISVTFTGGPESVLWTGATSGAWDVNSTANWDNGGSADHYYEFDDVTFDDSATGTTSVVLNDSVSPGSITFSNNSSNYSLTGSGSIDGAADLTVTGSGSVNIATDNSFTGGTDIQSGTVQIGNGGTTGSLGTGMIANEGTLAVNRSDTFTLANPISGSGSFHQNGTGTTVLTSNNSYTGTTAISNGTLQVGDGGATGSLGATSGITNDGTLAFKLNGALTVSVPITGTGEVIQEGPGSVVLAEDMTYSGGTSIHGGSLQIGMNDTFGSVNGDILNDGDLLISRSDNIDFSNSVNGSGSVVHAGSGDLRLTGANTYSGNTGVSGGGYLVLDSSGSGIPAGAGLWVSDGGVDFTDLDLVVSSLAKHPSGYGAIQANPGSTLTVEGDVLANEGTLDLVALDAFVVDNPGGSFKASTTTSGLTANTYLAYSNTITTSLFAIGKDGPGGFGTSSNATVELGETNVIHADTVTVGDNSAQSGSSTLRFAFGLTTPTLEIRASDGIGRADMVVGSKGTSSDYSGGTATIDLGASGSTLDALVGTLTIGRHGGGAGNFNNATSGTFIFNEGTLDANSIVMGVGNSPNNKTADGTLTTYGGTIRTGSLTLVQDVGGAIGTATVNLEDGGTLEATTIIGQAAGNAFINLNAGTLRSLSGTDLTINSTTINLPSDTGTRTIDTGANTATLASGSVIASSFHSVAPADPGGFTLTGTLVLSDVSLTLTDLDAGSPAALTAGTKLVLINYAGASLTGTFSGIADGDSIVVGPNTFIIDYDDPDFGNKAVTLTAQNTTTPYEDWLIANGITPGDPNTLPSDDYDGDGTANMVEYVLNTDPDGGTQTNPPIVANAGSDMTFTFTRLKEAITAGYTTEVEYAETLDGTWTLATAGMFGTPVDNGDTETLTVTIPIPGGATKLFARLKVTAP